MKPLSELMQEQIRTDAPPLRHSVDDVVAVGRRRVRRRNSGWTLAAAVSVAAAIGVPQLAGRHPAPNPAPPAATATASETARGFRIPSVVRFGGYQTKSYKVDAPTTSGLGFTSANVFRRGTTITGGPSSGASLDVFEPGIDPAAWTVVKNLAPAGRINGRPASRFTSFGSREGLIWEYADGASAVLLGDSGGPTADDLREVAEGFRLTAERPVALAYKVGYLPDGFRLTDVIQDQSLSAATFLPTVVARDQLAGSGRRLFGIDQTKGSINLSMSAVPVPGADPDCDSLRCRVLPGGRYQLTISGSISETEAQKVLDAVIAFTPDDVSTWIPVEQAVPERYLVTE